MPLNVDAADIATVLLVTADMQSGARIIKALTEMNDGYRGKRIDFVVIPAYYDGMVDFRCAFRNIDALVTDRTLRRKNAAGTYKQVEIRDFLWSARAQGLSSIEVFRPRPRPLSRADAEFVAKQTLMSLRRRMSTPTL